MPAVMEIPSPSVADRSSRLLASSAAAACLYWLDLSNACAWKFARRSWSSSSSWFALIVSAWRAAAADSEWLRFA
eukprot:CAMPEP_0119498722 /NCGR_PEP_ID=MMETSP1344-20130328/21398_1 /TAXON_ID=236787 /ORGANISM="Florenciella parvula, Strain CCMP2471" /LENGTH=74 /DNA_ID=CAMNT_0007534639 /DNA_START=25 /DNA_END=249 /DNA_ORIENTATION=-